MSTSLLSHVERVKESSKALARQNTKVKDHALSCIAQALRANQDAILKANSSDLIAGQAKGLSEAFLDRLTLTPERIEAMAQAIEEVISLEDPIGRIEQMGIRPSGIRVGRQRIPLGVVGIIYESRPNVTSDAAALCLKSGNGVVLKGGSDAFGSNQAIYNAMVLGLRQSDLPREAQGAIGFINTTDRAAVVELLKMDHAVDVIIPRGGKGLVRFVNEHARMPVIKHDEGVCHVVIEGSADVTQVVDIALNAKVQRPGVCNAVETFLMLENAMDEHLPKLLRALSEQGVVFHLCPRSRAVAQSIGIESHEATEEAYAKEFLCLEVALKIVDTLEDAIAHIDRFGSNHTESLLTQRYDLSQQFLRQVDSAVVMINASTRFSDGGQLGLGAEIGISTTRMHAYGPMGIDALTTTKFIVQGDGQIRT